MTVCVLGNIQGFSQLSVLASCFIRGVVHSSYTPKKIRKIRNKLKKSKDFCEDLKSAHLIWEWTTLRIQCLNPFLFIKSSKTTKKFRQIRKNPKKFEGFFFENLKSVQFIWEWTTSRNLVSNVNSNFHLWQVATTVPSCGSSNCPFGRMKTVLDPIISTTLRRLCSVPDSQTAARIPAR